MSRNFSLLGRDDMRRRSKFRQLIGILMVLLFIIAPNDCIRASDKIKVAFYEYYPYYYLNEQLQPSGYYHDLMNLIANDLNLDYEYVDVPINQALDKLKNKEIDLLFGISSTPKRQEEYLFSKYYININRVGLFTNHNIRYGDLEALNGMTIGFIENEQNYQRLLNMLEGKNINVNLKIVDSYESTLNLFRHHQVDAILYSAEYTDLDKKYRNIFEFSTGSFYIVTNKENKELMTKIDSYFEQYDSLPNNPIHKLYESYFNLYKQKSDLFILIITILILIILTFGLKLMLDQMKIKKNRQKILNDLEQNKFLLYYQPIINPNTNRIVGCETLLRYQSGVKIQTPYFFLKQIEESNMMYEVTMWVLRKAIEDYDTITSSNDNLENNFYLSINVSFKELQDARFLTDLEELIKVTNANPQQFCLEIVERFQLSDVEKIQDIILKLKKIGFKIAIDDFGAQYSNFDVLEMIDYDMIKLDKYFIVDIESSFRKREIMKCMSNITKENKTIMVIEGVESYAQVEMIRTFDNDTMYIQGYYYSKPVPLDKVITLKIKSEILNNKSKNSVIKG
jgi:cyclic diguanylate phosphodiesterase (EAL) domain protein